MLAEILPKYCECGCGQVVKTKGHHFHPGHARKGKHIKGQSRHCANCGKLVWIFAKDLKIDNFCSRNCYYQFARGKNTRENNPNWRGGRAIISGRPAIYLPNHKRASKEGYVYEQILIAEKVLGRELKYIRHAHGDNEIVHHINGDKMDNRNLNLLICSESYHKYLHGKMRGGLNYAR